MILEQQQDLQRQQEHLLQLMKLMNLTKTQLREQPIKINKL
jgi:hypothetical protein